MRFVVLAFLASVALSSCIGRDVDVTILAASSLTQVLPQAVATPNITSSTSFVGSAALATQVEEGRSAEIVITANRETMDRIVASGRVDGDPIALVQNRIVIAVPNGNPAEVQRLADLASSSLRVAACAPEVPCGAIVTAIAVDQDLELAIDSFDPNVRAVITRVETAAVDAGLVYATDANTDRTETIEIDPDAAFTTTYFVARLVGASPESGDVIAQLLDAGRDTLIDAGFIAP